MHVAAVSRTGALVSRIEATRHGERPTMATDQDQPDDPFAVDRPIAPTEFLDAEDVKRAMADMTGTEFEQLNQLRTDDVGSDDEYPVLAPITNERARRVQRLSWGVDRDVEDVLDALLRYGLTHYEDALDNGDE